jgi:thiamine-phosphate pyrophosphorylase
LAKLPELTGLYRVIDANINRAKEGLRVCEEITRFILDSKTLTSDLKKIRHEIDPLAAAFRRHPELLSQRDSLKDVGLKIYSRAELKRRDFADVFNANIQRVKESVRVLEEFSKLDDVKIALGFRKIRYDIYDFEKRVAKKVSSLRNRKQAVL